MKRPLLVVKMLRDIRRSLSAYLISGCIVMIGVVGYSVLSITCDSLDSSRQQFYRDSNFADAFAEVYMAPRAVERQIARIEGVAQAQGRMVSTARVVSLPPGVEAELKLFSIQEGGLCLPLLQKGSMPQRNELLLSADFMKAHGLSIGDRISMDLDGRRAHLRISGTALAPETVYMVKNIADMLPDPAKYDAGYIPYHTMTAITGQAQQANSFVMLLDGQRSFEQLEPQLEQLLKPYGVTATYPLADQFSHSMLEAEITQLRKVASSVPLMFLGIAAIIITITLSRLVEQQRTQIGTLMALGLTPKGLLWHYSSYGALLGLVSGILGGVIGVFSADAMGSFYRDYFKIPSYGLYVSPGYIIGGAVLSVLVCGAIAGLSAKSVLKLTPAVALRPAPPPKASKTFLESIPMVWGLLTVPGRIAVRGLFRNKRKTVLSIVGVAAAYMISASLLSMYSMIDLFVFDYLEETQRQDLIVSFVRPVSEADARRAIRSEQVERAEAVAELPITLQRKEAKLDCTLMGLPVDSRLYKLYDAAGVRVPVGETGLVISQHMSNLLDAGIGDMIQVKVSYPIERMESVQVTGIAEQYLGSTVYCSRKQLARISNLGESVTALYLQAPIEVQHQLREHLQDTGIVGGIQSRIQRLDAYKTMMGSFNGILYGMALMGVAIGFAVVYTGSLISFEELKREISTLLGLGLSTSQAVEIIAVGQWMIAIAGMLLGWPLTIMASRGISRSMTTELYSIPDFVSGSALAVAVGLTMLSVWLGTLVLYRRIGKMNPVELLRERE